MRIDYEEAMQRIIDMYDYYGFLQLVFGQDDLAEQIIELTEIDNDEPEAEASTEEEA